jgi:hypothetical protein
MKKTSKAKKKSVASKSKVATKTVAASTAAHPYQIGKTYVIRTVTMIQLGRLTAVYPQELVLEDASWIADTGRFANFLKDPELRSESEPFCAPCIVGRGAIVDAQIVKDVVLAQK